MLVLTPAQTPHPTWLCYFAATACYLLLLPAPSTSPTQPTVPQPLLFARWRPNHLPLPSHCYFLLLFKPHTSSNTSYFSSFILPPHFPILHPPRHFARRGPYRLPLPSSYILTPLLLTSQALNSPNPSYCFLTLPTAPSHLVYLPAVGRIASHIPRTVTSFFS